MKKIFGILTLSVLLAMSLFAQDEGQSQVSTGKLAFDINFNPAAIFDANAGPMFTMPYIKARYFLRSDIAIRLGLGLEYGTTKNFTDPTNNDYYKRSDFRISIAPGVEKHFGSKKFFAYVGAAIPISSYSVNTKEEYGGDTYDTKNPYGYSYFGIGVDIIAGIDYYILKNFYIGAELSPGFSYLSYKDSENSDGDVIDKGGNTMGFGLSSSSGIRIGVRF